MDVPLKFRSFVTGKKISLLAIIFLFLVQYVGSSTVTFSDEISLKERQHLQALQLRENSKAKAQSQLGYENVYGDPRDRQIDYYALNQQINHLSNIIKSLAENDQVNKDFRSPPSVLPRSLNPVGNFNIPDKDKVYGPLGPSDKAVRLLLEYQLMVNGNERLQVGKIVENETFITAEVVTVEGSLVERYKIDKSNGSWVTD
ncbi:hypothetical protein [Kiloniella antarctica]|uniref:Uncharacterized protein n=1 Tax=Kiloniella antarctica TaxID=1550907 RepID=A0ABW5BQH6_9PROT